MLLLLLPLLLLPLLLPLLLLPLLLPLPLADGAPAGAPATTPAAAAAAPAARANVSPPATTRGAVVTITLPAAGGTPVHIRIPIILLMCGFLAWIP